jgi:hypothetical protein
MIAVQVRIEQLEMFTLGGFESAPFSDFGQVLSPTQVRTFIDCQVRWYFKYVEHLDDPQNASLALGKAVHAALAENFLQKIDTFVDLPVLGVVALFRRAWQEQVEETVFRPDDDVEQLGKCGEVLVTKYMGDAAPLIQPVAVEMPVAGEIGGVPVRGIVDLVDSEGQIIDLKTRCRRPTGIASDTAFQLTTYYQLTTGANGMVRIDTLVKTKAPQLIQQSYSIGARDLKATGMLYPLARKNMQRGGHVPNRVSMLCSRKNCPFWERCEEEFGGRVGEA